MEGCKFATALTTISAMVVLVAIASFGGAAAVEDFGAPAPSPMESAGVALRTPVAVLGALASLVAWIV